MKKNLHHISLLIIIMLNAGAMCAQDIHFSQFYVNPVMLNPAKTGFFDGNYRLTGIYRNQWASVTVPYQTFAFSSDFSINDGRYTHSKFGVGLMASADKAGDGSLTTDQIGVSLAYNKALDADSRFFLGYGMLGTYNGAHVDLSKLYFGDQYENAITSDNTISGSTNYFDVSAGLEWNFLATKYMNFCVGGAVYHINEPAASWMGDGTTKLYRKYSVNASATLPLGETQFSLLPKLNYAQQGAMHENVFGVIGKMDLSARYGKTDYAAYVGIMDRWDDAVFLVGRFDVEKLSFGFSYDINHSSLVPASFGSGGPEISVSYYGAISSFRTKPIYCPKF